MMYVYTRTLPGACGVGHAHGFMGRRYETHQREVDSLQGTGGCNWLTAGFVNEVDCRNTYNELCRNYKLEYQSPIRVNGNSGNRFFFAVWDTSQRPDGSRR